MTKIAVSNVQVNHKLPPGDPSWGRFNASFDNLELQTEILMDMIYKGQSITTWHKDHWRKSENYICGQHLGLDFDGGDKTSTLEYLAQDKFILKYGGLIYTTMSHTQEHPRARVIFTLDTPIMQSKNYTLAASSLLWLFGTADRQCKDAVRFFYGSKGCEFEYINQVLPLDVVKKLIGEYQETGSKEKHKATQNGYHAPASQQEVADALKMIPVWKIDYDEWVSVLMAIHSEFGEGGYQLAESWGDGKQGEIDQKWKSFKASGNPAGVVTIATLFGIAKRFGWHKTNSLTI